eukprot:14211871-Alexandrium_andersonii.AAC.1
MVCAIGRGARWRRAAAEAHACAAKAISNACTAVEKSRCSAARRTAAQRQRFTAPSPCGAAAANDNHGRSMGDRPAHRA